MSCTTTRSLHQLFCTLQGGPRLEIQQLIAAALPGASAGKLQSERRGTAHGKPTTADLACTKTLPADGAAGALEHAAWAGAWVARRPLSKHHAACGTGGWRRSSSRRLLSCTLDIAQQWPWPQAAAALASECHAPGTHTMTACHGPAVRTLATRASATLGGNAAPPHAATSQQAGGTRDAGGGQKVTPAAAAAPAPQHTALALRQQLATANTLHDLHEELPQLAAAGASTSEHARGRNMGSWHRPPATDIDLEADVGQALKGGTTAEYQAAVLQGALQAAEVSLRSGEVCPGTLQAALTALHQCGNGGGGGAWPAATAAALWLEVTLAMQQLRIPVRSRSSAHPDVPQRPRTGGHASASITGAAAGDAAPSLMPSIGLGGGSTPAEAQLSAPALGAGADADVSSLLQRLECYMQQVLEVHMPRHAPLPADNVAQLAERVAEARSGSLGPAVQAAGWSAFEEYLASLLHTQLAEAGTDVRRIAEAALHPHLTGSKPSNSSQGTALLSGTWPPSLQTQGVSALVRASAALATHAMPEATRKRLSKELEALRNDLASQVPLAAAAAELGQQLDGALRQYTLLSDFLLYMGKLASELQEGRHQPLHNAQDRYALTWAMDQVAVHLGALVPAKQMLPLARAAVRVRNFCWQQQQQQKGPEGPTQVSLLDVRAAAEQLLLAISRSLLPAASNDTLAAGALAEVLLGLSSNFFTDPRLLHSPEWQPLVRAIGMAACAHLGSLPGSSSSSSGWEALPRTKLPAGQEHIAHGLLAAAIEITSEAGPSDLQQQLATALELLACRQALLQPDAVAGTGSSPAGLPTTPDASPHDPQVAAAELRLLGAAAHLLSLPLAAARVEAAAAQPRGTREAVAGLLALAQGRLEGLVGAHVQSSVRPHAPTPSPTAPLHSNQVVDNVEANTTTEAPVAEAEPGAAEDAAATSAVAVAAATEVSASCALPPVSTLGLRTGALHRPEARVAENVLHGYKSLVAAAWAVDDAPAARAAAVAMAVLVREPHLLRTLPLAKRLGTVVLLRSLALPARDGLLAALQLMLPDLHWLLRAMPLARAEPLARALVMEPPRGDELLHAAAAPVGYDILTKAQAALLGVLAEQGASLELLAETTIALEYQDRRMQWATRPQQLVLGPAELLPLARRLRLAASVAADGAGAAPLPVCTGMPPPQIQQRQQQRQAQPCDRQLEGGGQAVQEADSALGSAPRWSGAQQQGTSGCAASPQTEAATMVQEAGDLLLQLAVSATAPAAAPGASVPSFAEPAQARVQALHVEVPAARDPTPNERTLSVPHLASFLRTHAARALKQLRLRHKQTGGEAGDALLGSGSSSEGFRELVRECTALLPLMDVAGRSDAAAPAASAGADAGADAGGAQSDRGMAVLPAALPAREADGSGPAWAFSRQEFAEVCSIAAACIAGAERLDDPGLASLAWHTLQSTDWRQVPQHTLPPALLALCAVGLRAGAPKQGQGASASKAAGRQQQQQLLALLRKAAPTARGHLLDAASPLHAVLLVCMRVLGGWGQANTAPANEALLPVAAWLRTALLPAALEACCSELKACARHNRAVAYLDALSAMRLKVPTARPQPDPHADALRSLFGWGLADTDEHAGGSWEGGAAPCYARTLPRTLPQQLPPEQLNELCCLLAGVPDWDEPLLKVAATLQAELLRSPDAVHSDDSVARATSEVLAALYRRADEAAVAANAALQRRLPSLPPAPDAADTGAGAAATRAAPSDPERLVRLYGAALGLAAALEAACGKSARQLLDACGFNAHGPHPPGAGCRYLPVAADLRQLVQVLQQEASLQQKASLLLLPMVLQLEGMRQLTQGVMANPDGCGDFLPACLLVTAALQALASQGLAHTPALQWLLRVAGKALGSALAAGDSHAAFQQLLLPLLHLAAEAHAPVELLQPLLAAAERHDPQHGDPLELLWQCTGGAAPAGSLEEQQGTALRVELLAACLSASYVRGRLVDRLADWLQSLATTRQLTSQQLARLLPLAPALAAAQPASAPPAHSAGPWVAMLRYAGAGAGAPGAAAPAGGLPGLSPQVMLLAELLRQAVELPEAGQGGAQAAGAALWRGQLPLPALCTLARAVTCDASTYRIFEQHQVAKLVGQLKLGLDWRADAAAGRQPPQAGFTEEHGQGQQQPQEALGVADLAQLMAVGRARRLQASERQDAQQPTRLQLAAGQLLLRRLEGAQGAQARKGCRRQLLELSGLVWRGRRWFALENLHAAGLEAGAAPAALPAARSHRKRPSRITKHQDQKGSSCGPPREPALQLLRPGPSLDVVFALGGGPEPVCSSSTQGTNTGDGQQPAPELPYAAPQQLAALQRQLAAAAVGLCERSWPSLNLAQQVLTLAWVTELVAGVGARGRAGGSASDGEEQQELLLGRVRALWQCTQQQAHQEWLNQPAANAPTDFQAACLDSGKAPGRAEGMVPQAQQQLPLSAELVALLASSGELLHGCLPPASLGLLADMVAEELEVWLAEEERK